MDGSSGNPVIVERQQEEHQEFLSYLWGLLAALALTLVPFGLVYSNAMPRHSLLIAVGVLAFLQMVVHFRFFLHLGPKRHGDEFKLIMFTVLMLIVMIGGTLWVMFNLAGKMMGVHV
ncbi:MAG: cytochrome o ubiquinol oxidase subunit IV [Acetobacteraceae bacterium]